MKFCFVFSVKYYPDGTLLRCSVLCYKILYCRVLFCYVQHVYCAFPVE